MKKKQANKTIVYKLKSKYTWEMIENLGEINQNVLDKYFDKTEKEEIENEKL